MAITSVCDVTLVCIWGKVARHLDAKRSFPVHDGPSNPPFPSSLGCGSHAAQVNTYTLLYTWKGSDPSLQPMLLISHMDVVPAPADKWTHPPFSGLIDEEYIWGRGTLDTKGSMVAILEALEELRLTGWAPQRTVLFAVGHDEENGGLFGAKQASAVLAERYPDGLDSIIDEGGFTLLNGLGPMSVGLLQPARLALVGLAEKGTQTWDVGVLAAGGHSSLPPAEGHSTTAIIGKMIAALDHEQMPAKFQAPATDMVRALLPLIIKPEITERIKAAAGNPVSCRPACMVDAEGKEGREGGEGGGEGEAQRFTLRRGATGLASGTLHLFEGGKGAQERRWATVLLLRPCRTPLFPLPSTGDACNVPAQDPEAGLRIAAAIAHIPALSYLVRSVHGVVGVAAGGYAHNVLPGTGSVTVNFRTIQGDTTEEVEAWLRRVTADPLAKGLTYTPRPNVMPPSLVTPADGPHFARLGRAVMETLGAAGGEGVLPMHVIPNLMSGGTDSRHYQVLAPGRVLRYEPFGVTMEDLSLLHGIDERMRKSSFLDGIKFYRRYIQLTAQPHEA